MAEAAAGTSGNSAQNWITAGSALVGAYGDYQASKGPGATTTTSRPAYLDNAAQNVLQRGAALADRPYSSYGGERVAGLSGNEQLAYGSAAGLSGKYQPLIDRASQQFNSQNLQSYMNPYTEGVLDVNARRINQNFDSQLGTLNAKRGMMDAFGSDRGTLLESQLQRGRAQALSDANVQGLSDAYNQGTSAFFNDKNASLNAAYTGSALDQQAINAQTATGALERGVRQSQDDFDYGQFIESRDWDMNNFKSLLDSLSAASGSSGSSTSKNSPMNMGGTLAGLAQTVAGAYLSSTNGATTNGATGALDGVGSGANANKAVMDDPNLKVTPLNPNSAGGEAATDASGIGFVTPSVSRVGGALDDGGEITPVQTTVSKVGDGSTGAAADGGMTVGGALSAVGSAASIYNGVQQGNAAGYAGALNGASNLAGYGDVPGLKYVDAVDKLSKGDTGGAGYSAMIAAAGPIAALGAAVADAFNKGGDKRSAITTAFTKIIVPQLGITPVYGSKNGLAKLPDGRFIQFGTNFQKLAQAAYNKDEAAYNQYLKAWLDGASTDLKSAAKNG